MYGERVERVRTAINERALVEDLPVSLRHVCLACADRLNVGGGGVLLASTLGLGEPVYATDPCSDRLVELQITVGEGPAVEAFREDRPVLVPDLSAAGARHRWPLFVPQAQSLGRRAVFAFPLLLGTTAVGVLEVSRAEPGWLFPEELADAFLFADAALMVTLEHDLIGAGGAPAGDGEGLAGRWSEVRRAVGMLSAQLEVGLAEAFARLRAHAYANDLRLADVAHDVITHRLRFEII
ncbi:hypothetical protein FHS43_000066 [Streptosporangium becharense]|uniref:ANTAR domain-containing protein n=1 Tax=Streptosporangium becharense TaxID=1816182 RepID=A0A7W9IGB6_9ACTN|nr:GAF and ANTAR domain-containing protein [Streptosporangium becharense]MBB2908820.1 hypothetical protein [Streptosporangium becharense]MBB5820162.1 hypothetical protein [Streptosporangium becharense]